MARSSALIAPRDRLRAWLLRDAFPVWWETGADRAHGGFHDLIALDGAAVAGPKRARVQARQAYCYARAPEFGWRGPWKVAMRHGLDFLEARYRRADGLYRTLVTDADEPADHGADLYDQAFVLLALAVAAQAGDGAAPAAAEALLSRLPAHPLGGFHELGDASLKANPNMHLFEAALAWIEAGGDARWRAVADGLGRLALGRLIDPARGALSEIFADDWSAATRATERRVEPGHQFEWAWLLMRWSVIAGEPRALAAALRLTEVGESAGIDPARGVAIDLMDGALSPIDRGARLWPQTERLKAALLAGQLTGEARWWAMAERAAAGLAPYLEVPVAGLWRDQLAPDGMFVEEPARASSFYHLIGAVAELERTVG